MATEEALPLRIHVLRQLNPMIACVLKSRAHRLASEKLLVLRYAGKKSGKLFTIPLAYVTHTGQTYCVTRNTQWWKSAVAAPSVTLWLRGEQVEAKAERADSADSETLAAFTRFLEDNPGTARLLYKVRVDLQGVPDAADVAREVHNANVIRFTALPS